MEEQKRLTPAEIAAHRLRLVCRVETIKGVQARVAKWGDAQLSFPFLRELFGDWKDSRVEFQKAINGFACAVGLPASWDWETGTHVKFFKE